MNELTILANQLNIPQLIAIMGMFWFFYNRIEKKMDARFDKVDKRFDKLEEKVTDIDRRLCRLEGAFSNKECCMIKDDRQLSKVE